MITTVSYTSARDAIKNLIKNEFPEFPTKIEAQLLTFYRNISAYEEEGVKIRPQIIFTNNIDALLKPVSDAYKLEMSHDVGEIWLTRRFKSLFPFCKKGWTVYVEVKEDKVTYGICKSLSGVKELGLVPQIFTNPNEPYKDKTDKIFAFFIGNTSTFTTNMYTLKGEAININYSLDEKEVFDWQKEIDDFAEASFSKVKTTQKKLKELKTIYRNILTNSFVSLHGALCVIVDKEYKDNGFLADGIWLENPIALSKMFMVQTSKNPESKLNGFTEILTGMLELDGITVVDNAGRIRAYNVFVENNFETTKNVYGGARKRAAYTIINSRRKKIIGVYFQSHDGEMFFRKVKK